MMCGSAASRGKSHTILGVGASILAQQTHDFDNALALDLAHDKLAYAA